MADFFAPKEPQPELVKIVEEGSFIKYVFAFVAVILLVGGVYFLIDIDNGGDKVVRETDNSFFAVAVEAARNALSGPLDEGEGLVEIVNVKTGERAVAGAPLEAGRVFESGEEERVAQEEVSLRDGTGEQPTEKVRENKSPPPPETLKSVRPININTAGYEELQQITGVGPAIAGRIIDYRQGNTPFCAVEEIQNVSGIGPKTFLKIREEIIVGGVGPCPEEPEEEERQDVALPPPPLPVDRSGGEAPDSEPETDIPGKININTAENEELQGITGVGPVIAGRIIDYRNVRGPFLKIEDIKSVRGIGDKTFEKMKGEITVGN